MKQSTDLPGGLGGECTDLPGARDTRMVEKAIRQRWAIPEDLRAKIPAVLGDIATSKRASHRNRIAAARALLAADVVNLEQEKRDAGGDTLNVNVNGSLTVEQRNREIAAICAAALERAGINPGPATANGAAKLH